MSKDKYDNVPIDVCVRGAVPLAERAAQARALAAAGFTGATDTGDGDPHVHGHGNPDR